jgi:hypothetical protein
LVIKTDMSLQLTYFASQIFTAEDVYTLRKAPVKAVNMPVMSRCKTESQIHLELAERLQLLGQWRI